ncbi:SusC/RagA family TonB-linked outer membrane protein [Niabella aurantiaca]|uniref:SusC/RagA family TonB-linked outer membrane protein n=1 Tax=Niabella aurantiaca TaxID=379900 RepID=UPI0003610BA2|nr:SusC/RagA family TonB-linked outer membrane protein [Niabella aurantiaca]
MIVQSTIHRALRSKPLLLGLALLLAPVLMFAQGKTVRGIVTSKETSEPIANATVLIRGTSRGTTTNAQGHYSISVSSSETLVFSAVGYKELPRKVDQQTVINAQLEGEEKQEEEVVVTALGIKKQDKSLGYALTKVDSTQLTDAVASNWTDALSGKVAGLHLIRSGSGPAASSKIILRGENNLTGENEALIVVDGVVINNSSGKRSANGSDLVYATNSDNLPADYGSSMNDINPQDIESVSVLKGPAAAALYGQRAANGAIIITTKSANQKKNGHFNIRYTINGSLEQINRYPDLQYEYGLGLDGQLDYEYGKTVNSSSSSAYGPRLDGQLFYQYDPITQTRSQIATPWVAYKNINDFWDIGRDLRNNISVDGKIGTTALRVNLGTENNKWIIPNTGFERRSAGFTTNTNITKKLKLSTKLNYGFKSSDNLPSAGYGNQSLMYWYIFWQPNADYNWLRNYWMGAPGSIYSSDSMYRRIRYPYSSYPENPFAVVNEFLNKTRRNSVTGNVTLNYQLTNELNLMLRGNLDWMNDKREQDRPYDAGSRLPKGSVRKQNIYGREMSYDFLARYNKNLSDDLKLGVSIGGSQLKNDYKKSDVRADGLRFPDSLNGSPYPGMYNLDSSLYGLIYIPDTSQYQINSIYGIVNISYKDYLFAELTGRQDWNSVLATADRTDNVGFFYPSLNTSFVLSDFTKLPSFISYAKLRASVARVGSGSTIPYRTAYTYPLASAGIYPDSALVNPTLLPNNNLKPLLTTTFELGAEAQFFRRRLGIDVAVYFGNTKDQILTRTVDASSGYTSATINAGTVRNNGVEVQLDGKPIVNSNGFNWSVSGTFSYNKNKIVEMPDSSVLLKAGQIASGQIVASIGGSMGDLYGIGYKRAPDGQVIYDETTGFPKLSDGIIYLGNTIPKYKFSLGNTFRFRQFSLKMLFDAQMGAVAYSLSQYKMAEQGKLKVTLPGRYNGIVGNGVLEVKNDQGEVTGYRKNDAVAYDIDQYYRYSIGTENAEGSTFSTDFLKFREATLSYAFKPRMLKKLGLTAASIGIFGRDLFIWSHWPIFDPEFGTLAGSDIVRGFEVAQFPSTRTMGFNLSVGF